MLQVNSLIAESNKGGNIDVIYTNRKLQRLQKIKRHELQMVEARGYDITSAKIYDTSSDQNKPGDDIKFVQFNNPEKFKEEIVKLTKTSFTFEQLKSMIKTFNVFTSRPGFSTLYTMKDKPDEHLFVVYLDNLPGRETGSKHFSLFHDILVSQRYKNFVIITEKGLTADKQKWIDQQTKDLSIEKFIDSEFIFNPLRHGLSSIETSVYSRGKSASSFLSEQGLENDSEKLPKMKKDDPQSRLRKLKPGTIVQDNIVSILSNTDRVVSIRKVC